MSGRTYDDIRNEAKPCSRDGCTRQLVTHDRCPSVAACVFRHLDRPAPRVLASTAVRTDMETGVAVVV